MKRLLPRTVAGQLFVTAMVALVLSQLVMFAIMAEERQRSARQSWTGYILSRIAATTELLDLTPEQWHQQVINASDTNHLTFHFTVEPPDPTTVINETSVYLTELRGMIPKTPDKVLVKARDPSWAEVLRHWIADWRGLPAPATEPLLEASVQLNNGKWLNLEVIPRLNPPPLALLLIPVVTMLAVFGSTLFVLIRYVTRPINRLANAASAFGRGEEVEPVTMSGPAEIREAIAAFNGMRERLSRFVLDRTRMLASVGHDLRTPITTMRLRAEFIDDEETRERILASLEEMQQMAEGALAFAREEALSEPTRLVDLNALVQTVCADQSDMNRNVIYRENGRLLYRCRPNSLKRAVRNLVENAVIHGQSASVSLRATPRDLQITVDDQGPGIPTEHMAQVFLPFARLDEARGEETGGIGLGLAIARSIVRGHGGDIGLVNREGGGLRVTLQLPVTG
ncbi:MAG: ATP-binding protein [Rhodomicrobiaceae bacterium]